jgi:hypothetical protein
LLDFFSSASNAITQNFLTRVQALASSLLIYQATIRTFIALHLISQYPRLTSQIFLFLLPRLLHPYAHTTTPPNKPPPHPPPPPPLPPPPTLPRICWVSVFAFYFLSRCVLLLSLEPHPLGSLPAFKRDNVTFIADHLQFQPC